MKRIILSFVLFFAGISVWGQSFMHGAGVTILASAFPETQTRVGYGLTYSPRFNFLETKNLSVSVGIPLSMGISVSSSMNSNPYDVSPGVVIHLPLIVNLNMGRGSTKENRQKFGYFVGAGAGFYHGDFLDYSTDSYSINSYGPAANAGVRLGVGKKHKNIEIRLSYMKGVNDNKRIAYDGFGNSIIVNYKPNIYGLACLFNF